MSADGHSIELESIVGRHCESEKEAFYEPLSKCFPIGGSCPEDHPNQLFYQLEGTNEGICDCKDEIGLVFHNQTGECYQLNTQVATKNLFMHKSTTKKNLLVVPIIAIVNCKKQLFNHLQK